MPNDVSTSLIDSSRSRRRYVTWEDSSESVLCSYCAWDATLSMDLRLSAAKPSLILVSATTPMQSNSGSGNSGIACSWAVCVAGGSNAAAATRPFRLASCRFKNAFRSACREEASSSEALCLAPAQRVDMSTSARSTRGSDVFLDDVLAEHPAWPSRTAVDSVVVGNSGSLGLGDVTLCSVSASTSGESCC